MSPLADGYLYFALSYKNKPNKRPLKRTNQFKLDTVRPSLSIARSGAVSNRQVCVASLGPTMKIYPVLYHSQFHELKCGLDQYLALLVYVTEI